MSKIRRSLYRAAGLLGAGLLAYATNTTPSIISVQPNGDHELRVLLSSSAKADPEKCIVFASSNREASMTVTCKRSPASDQQNLIIIETQETVDPNDGYEVRLQNVLFDKLAAILTGQSQPTPPAAAGRSSTNKGSTGGRPCLVEAFTNLAHGKLTAADPAGPPDLSFTGTITHSAGGSFQGTYALTGNFTSLCRIGQIGPSINLQGGNDPNGTPDSLNFNFLWDRALTLGQGRFESIHLVQTGTLESTQDFLQKAIVYGLDMPLRFKPRISENKKFIAALYPDFGLEAGKNIRSVIPTASGSGIVRLKIGANEYLNWKVGKSWLKNVSLNTTWTRRWPLIGEVSFKTNKAGAKPQFLPAGIGTGPRDYVKPSLSLGLTDYVSLTASYEYGSLPPKYSQVNGKFTFGLTIKASFARSNGK